MASLTSGNINDGGISILRPVECTDTGGEEWWLELPNPVVEDDNIWINKIIT